MRQEIAHERIFTEAQVEQIIAEVRKWGQETQIEEADRSQEENQLPIEIFEDLEEYSINKLQGALQKLKHSTHRYNRRQ